MATLTQNVNRAVKAFKDIKSAIEGKGVEVGNAPVEEYADRIAEITIGEGQEIFINVDGRMYTRRIEFPDNVTKIGSSAYYKCTHLAEAIMGSNITEIGQNAFQGCNDMTEVYIPEGVVTIKQNAFFGNPISKIYFPATLETIGNAPFTTLYFRNVTLGKGFDCSLNIKDGSYTVDVMLAMFEALKDNTGLEAKTLTLGSTNLAKLTEEQKQIATNKNWNLA